MYFHMGKKKNKTPASPSPNRLLHEGDGDLKGTHRTGNNNSNNHNSIKNRSSGHHFRSLGLLLSGHWFISQRARGVGLHKQLSLQQYDSLLIGMRS